MGPIIPQTLDWVTWLPWFLHCKLIYIFNKCYLKHFYLDIKVYCWIYNTSLQMKYFIRWCVKRLSFFFLFVSCLITWLCWSVNIKNATSFNVQQPQPQRNSNHHHSTTNSCHHSNTQALGDMQEGGSPMAPMISGKLMGMSKWVPAA